MIRMVAGRVKIVVIRRVVGPEYDEKPVLVSQVGINRVVGLGCLDP